MKRSQLYWICQFTGWSLYIVINSIFLGLSRASSFRELLIYLLMLPVGIAITHAYRILVIKKFGLVRVAVPSQLAAILGCSILMGIAFLLTFLAGARLLSLEVPALGMVEVTEYILNFSAIFFLWNMLYFGFQYFQNYKRSEIDALKHLAASREAELNNLKAQLNPHFIFNCMNSIRALIDENPSNAKSAVTMLSNILRNTLQIDKSREVTLAEELRLVKDYLDLEKIRYEERLAYVIDAAPEVQQALVPPFIVQSQVENAIKHGISRLPGRGVVRVDVRREGSMLMIRVSNTGNINSQQPLTGVGFMNSIQRLRLLYGEQGQISIEELDEMVVVDINIPIRKYESNNS